MIRLARKQVSTENGFEPDPVSAVAPLMGFNADFPRLYHRITKLRARDLMQVDAWHLRVTRQMQSKGELGTA